ncbi:MAG: hypothetical protein ABSE40_19375 [Candidatus Sulfotelmatobacter sp.]|jgi:hypothetical protein
MVPFMRDGKQYVRNMDTGKEYPVADIELPSINEMLAMGEERAKKLQLSKRQKKRSKVRARSKPSRIVTRAELIQLAQHYSSEVAEYRNDRERFPEDGISSREYNRYVYALRRLGRIETLLAEAPVYEGMEEAGSNPGESGAPEKENTDAKYRHD